MGLAKGLRDLLFYTCSISQMAGADPIVATLLEGNNLDLSSVPEVYVRVFEGQLEILRNLLENVTNVVEYASYSPDKKILKLHGEDLDLKTLTLKQLYERVSELAQKEQD